MQQVEASDSTQPLCPQGAPQSCPPASGPWCQRATLRQHGGFLPSSLEGPGARPRGVAQ